jgi:predicted small lipoprotein YifL
MKIGGASLAALLLATALLAGCGKKGAPTAPGPQDEIMVPKSYPKPV